MRTALLLLCAAALQAEPFKLEPGEFRWVPITVTRVPTAVSCRFRVVSGKPTLHMEIMAMSEFRHFNRKRDYDTLAFTPDGSEGEIRRMVDEHGEYAVVVENANGAPPALVDVEVSTDVDPSEDSMARVLPPGRRLAVILISFAIFFALVTWSAWRLLRATKFSFPSVSAPRGR
jgi:hypothetical protein